MSLQGAGWSVKVSAGVVLGEELLELGELVLTVNLSQQALQHESNVLLVVYSLDHSNRVLEGRDGHFDVFTLVRIVAIDLAKFVQDETRCALQIDHLRLSLFVVCLRAQFFS